MVFRSSSSLVLGVALASAVALLSACSSKSEKAEAAAICPKAYIVGDASQLTRFKPGPGRDPTDVAFRADVLRAENRCEFSRDGLTIDTNVTLGVQEGPSAENRQASFNYFVALIGPTNQIVAREEFTADYKFEGNRTRLAGVEELRQRAGITSDTAAGYRVAVGIALTPQELDYNRRLQR